LTYKSVKNGGAIDEQREIAVIVDNLANTIELLEAIGAEAKAYQETPSIVFGMANPFL